MAETEEVKEKSRLELAREDLKKKRSNLNAALGTVVANGSARELNEFMAAASSLEKEQVLVEIRDDLYPFGELPGLESIKDTNFMVGGRIYHVVNKVVLEFKRQVENARDSVRDEVLQEVGGEGNSVALKHLTFADLDKVEAELIEKLRSDKKKDDYGYFKSPEFFDLVGNSTSDVVRALKVLVDLRAILVERSEKKEESDG